jgi:hypothetical protein
MKRYWVISPYDAAKSQIFDRVWEYDLSSLLNVKPKANGRDNLKMVFVTQANGGPLPPLTKH